MKLWYLSASELLKQTFTCQENPIKFIDRKCMYLSFVEHLLLVKSKYRKVATGFLSVDKSLSVLYNSDKIKIHDDFFSKCTGYSCIFMMRGRGLATTLLSDVYYSILLPIQQPSSITLPSSSKYISSRTTNSYKMVLL